MVKFFTRHSLGCNLGDYDMDVNGPGAFGPPWNGEQMFGRWSGHRGSKHIKHRVPDSAPAAKCQRTETNRGIYLETGKTISRGQRSPITPLLFLWLFLWDWGLVLSTLWLLQDTKDTVMEDSENQWQILEGGDSLFNFCRVSAFLIISSN